jgi:hypothetical protein
MRLHAATGRWQIAGLPSWENLVENLKAAGMTYADQHPMENFAAMQ